MNTDMLNLDESFAEYFEFRLRGNVYRMRYPTVEETDIIRDTARAGEEVQGRELMFALITPLDPEVASIRDVYKTMPINQWNALFSFIIEKMNK